MTVLIRVKETIFFVTDVVEMVFVLTLKSLRTRTLVKV